MTLPKPGYIPPPGKPEKWDMVALEKHCETAVLLELHTIPLYLFAMYCIDDDGEDEDPSTKLRGIVLQEMLHLTLAGNIMCALGFQPVLYGANHTPKFPCEIFYDNTALHLWPPHADAIQTFIKLERPFRPIRNPQTNIMPGYGSIGEFYDYFGIGMSQMNDETSGGMFKPNTSRQFDKNDNVYPDGGLYHITNIDSAMEALRLIVEQGEGSSGLDSENTPSHYHIFKELEKKEITYYHTVADPKTSDFKGNIQTAMLACDAAYSYLLLTIEKTWAPEFEGHRKDLVRNIMPLMKFVMKPIAEFLVRQKLDASNYAPLNGDERAAPPFNYFHFTSTASAKSELVKAIEAALEAYPENGKLTYALKGANDLFDLSQGNSQAA